ncbi:hypothetical protein KXD40_008127 [Peronospora effusa]|uniref:Uncharacterized protein n=1 Tax=Peronospora effusa TaxID=542832 RepID=A0A3M6VDV7_9STRA|nr:hypothetical protein DD238_005648 [Peronospora effusa]UIZ23988.1 hypothetical protein KXD40_008127 [Peronospora effusa]CAI5714509.1 unnamed protein product [Peronospora effusa]
MAPSMQWLQAHDPAAPNRYSTSHLSYRGIRLPKVVIHHSVNETSRLRKLTSLTYLSNKLGSVFHREHRDTIACEEDEEHVNYKRNIYEIIRHNDESADTSRGLDHLAKFSMPVGQSTSISTTSYEPSKEQRWCTNCSKCFQRRLSRYDQYCGLDCKTAHRMRQTAWK